MEVPSFYKTKSTEIYSFFWLGESAVFREKGPTGGATCVRGMSDPLDGVVFVGELPDDDDDPFPTETPHGLVAHLMVLELTPEEARRMLNTRAFTVPVRESKRKKWNRKIRDKMSTGTCAVL